MANTEATSARSTLACVIRSRKRQGEQVFEGEVTIPGLTTAKLTQVRTKEPYYSTTNAVRQAARAFASRWGADITVEDSTSTGRQATTTTTTTTRRGRGKAKPAEAAVGSAS